MGCRAEAGEEKAVGEGALDIEHLGRDGKRKDVGVQSVGDGAADKSPAAAMRVGVIGRAVVADDDSVTIIDFAAANERGIRARRIKERNIGTGGDIELEGIGLAAVLIAGKEIGSAIELESEGDICRAIDIADEASFKSEGALGVGI